jgi:ParB family chromosome partitioning protein
MGLTVSSAAIVTEGNEKGELRKVCANPDCPIHHARKQKPAHDAQFKAEQEKRRRKPSPTQPACVYWPRLARLSRFG